MCVLTPHTYSRGDPEKPFCSPSLQTHCPVCSGTAARPSPELLAPHPAQSGQEGPGMAPQAGQLEACGAGKAVQAEATWKPGAAGRECESAGRAALLPGAPGAGMVSGFLAGMAEPGQQD